MKAFKMMIICAISVFMFTAFCGCRMEDGKVGTSPSKAPTATADRATTAPKATDDSNMGEDIGRGIENIGDDIGRGAEKIGEDIKDASGAAKQVNS